MAALRIPSWVGKVLTLNLKESIMPYVSPSTLARLASYRREHVIAALKLRALLRALPYWMVAPYVAQLRHHRKAARFYTVRPDAKGFYERKKISTGF